jgi:hypothetical protein
MFDDYRGLEIWPSGSFDRYLEITKKEVKRLLIDKGELIDVSCPACNSDKKNRGFKKFGLEYVECRNCKTLYVSPRPTEENIRNYFIKSKASDFWQSHVVKQSLKGRIEHLFRPRAMWIASLTEEYFENPKVFADINSIYNEFLEEIDILNLFREKMIIDPAVNIADSLNKEKGFKIINKSITSVDLNEICANAVTALVSIDRVFNPKKFLRSVRSILIDGGLLFFTTSTISGFDLQVLWNNSKTIFPPDKINLLSIEGIETLLEKCGFEIIELSTPGQLDVELVKNAMQNNDKLKVSRFVSYLINNRDENALLSFQEFLQQFNLSSHVRVAARRK